MPVVTPEIVHRTISESANSLALRAGPLAMRFDPGNAFLRHIRLGDFEVLRGVYVAVRDQYWATIGPEVRIQSLDRQDDSFFILYEAVASSGDVNFHWTGTIRGSSDGGIRFGLDGRARSTFLRNRIGFCILHPAEACAGQPLQVQHVDGSIEEAAFPQQIAPHQPFLNIRAITHVVTDGVSLEVRMQGDTFEMEDQRNWTDASFKTYSTPLSLPHPVEVSSGTEVRQAVSLTLHRATPGAITRALTSRVRDTITAAAPVVVQQADHEVAIRVDGSSRAADALPSIGFDFPPGADVPSPEDIRLVRALEPAHVRASVDFSSERWREDVRAASSLGESMKTEVELAVLLGAPSPSEVQFVELSRALAQFQPSIARIFLLGPGAAVTAAEHTNALRRAIEGMAIRAPVGGGTSRYFTQLNRDRPPPEVFEVVCYSLNPQVHVFDSVSMVETLPIQGETVRNARSFLPRTSIAPGPITLKPRFVRGEGGASIPTAPDTRHASRFGACWTLGSIKYLAAAQAESITYYELCGAGGVVPGNAGVVHPLYHVFADVAEWSQAEILTTNSSRPLEVDALTLRLNGRLRILLANMSHQTQTVRVRLPDLIDVAQVTVRTLGPSDEASATANPNDWRLEARRPYAPPSEALPSRRVRELPFLLDPHAYICVDA